MFRDYKNYDVLEDGRILSKKSNKFLKPQTRPSGYQQVCLIDNEGKKHWEYVHRVTWIAVNGVWEIPKDYEIHHIDECTTNNHISNLLLCSHQENCNHGTRNERIAKTQTNRQDQSKRVVAFKNGELIMCFPSTREAGRLGFNQGHVAECCRGEKKTHKGYEWRYLDE